MSELKCYEKDNLRYWSHHGDLLQSIDDQPAWHEDNIDFWLDGGLIHRSKGPAWIENSGEVRWWLHGKQLKFAEWLEQTDATVEEKTLLKLRYG